jgi:MFS family permease
VLAVLALCAVQFVDVLGGTVVITALPTMLTDLGAPQSAAGLVVTGYAMFFGGLLVLGARCGDRYGHRRVLLAGIVLFGLASPVAALSGDVVVVVAARCGQGAAAALSVPAALRLLTALPVDRRRSLAWWSASGAAAGASGLLLGGLVTQWASWRAIFWFTLVLAGVLVIAVRRAVPPGPGGGSSLDVLGAVLLTAAVMAWVVGASLLEFARWRLLGLGLVLLGVLLVPVLVAVERRHRAPLVPGSAVRNRNLRAGAIGSFLNTATTSSAVTLVTLHLQGIDHVSAAAAGLLLLPFSLAVVGGAAVAAPFLRRWSPRAALATGLAFVAVGILALVPLDGAAVAVPFCLAWCGAGLGLASVAANGAGTDVPAALAGIAAGVLNTAAQVGTAIGVAVILLVAALSGSGGPATGAGSGWAAAGALAVLGVALFGRTRLAPGGRDGYSGPVGAGNRAGRS